MAKRTLRTVVLSALLALPSSTVGAQTRPPGPTVPSKATAPPLGGAGTFAVLGGSTVTNTGPTALVGDLGVAPGTAITGFPPGTLSGTVHGGDAVAQQAQLDVGAAYAGLVAETCTSDRSGIDLGGLTLTPGVYCFAAAAQLTGTVTLDAQGKSGAVFVFQIGSTLTTAAAAKVVLVNGAQACNVFWQVGSSATLGVGTSFSGDILAQASITLTTGATVAGRALARAGAVTLDTNQVAIPVCAAPVPCAADPDGTPCDDANACTLTDACLAGACVGSNPVACGPGGLCSETGTCNPSSGACEFPTPPCGSSTGDPHFMTFDGLYYDMQATGDFVLARTPLVEVQVRQAPYRNSPHVSVNVAAAARFGPDRLAVYVAPLRILLNGVPTVLTANALTLPSGATATQTGSVIRFAGPTGKITFNASPTYVNVGVKLDESVVDITGLLGNRNGSPDDDLVTRDGRRLVRPISFGRFYEDFAWSWVVRPSESLFDGVPDAAPVFLSPTRLFGAADLPADARSSAERVCTAARVTDPALARACTLDVAVLGPAAAEVFASLAAPRRVLELDGTDPTARGCNCTTVGDRASTSAPWLLLAAALTAWARRKRD